METKLVPCEIQVALSGSEILDNFRRVRFYGMAEQSHTPLGLCVIADFFLVTSVKIVVDEAPAEVTVQEGNGADISRIQFPKYMQK